jgi:hypothetical protein
MNHCLLLSAQGGDADEPSNGCSATLMTQVKTPRHLLKPIAMMTSGQSLHNIDELARLQAVAVCGSRRMYSMF